MLPFINELLNEKILQFLRNEAKYVSAVAVKDSKSKTLTGDAEKAEDIPDNNETAGE
jgi:GTPase Era involved in 16S rRNA processing